MSLRLMFAVAVAFAAVAHPSPPRAAPARKPPPAPVPYLFKSAVSLADLDKTLAGPGAHGADLVKPGPMALEVVWKHEEETEQNALEVHEGRDHVFFVTDGRAVFTLGGALDVSPGEWRALHSTGSQVVEAK